MLLRFAAIVLCTSIITGCGVMKTATKAGAKTTGFAAKASTRAAWGVAKTGGRVVTAPLRDRDHAPPSQGRPHSYTVHGKRYHVMSHEQARRYRETGTASYYGRESGPKTASGERFNTRAMTAAHKTLPLGTRVRVRNLENGRSAVFRINDRGPFVRGRVIDVTPVGANRLGFRQQGLTRVRVETLR